MFEKGVFEMGASAFSSRLKNPKLPKEYGGNGVPPSKILRIMRVLEGAALSAPVFQQAAMG